MLGQCARVVAGGVKIRAVFDEAGALGAHRGVLLGGIAEGDDDGARNAGPGVGMGEGLPVIAAHGADDPGRAEMFEVGECAADLEGAGGRVVFVLDLDFAAGALREQRPGELRRGRKMPPNQGFGGMKVFFPELF